MLNAQMVKQIALSVGADVVGIASMDRFEGAPKQMDPRYAMPEAKSMIVMGHRIMRGSLRGVEEGTFFGNYSAMGYGYINYHILPWTARYLSTAIEDEGYEAMPIGYHFDAWAPLRNTDGAWREGSPYSKPVREGLPSPDVYMSMRIAAFLAGLGEIGYSKVFLSSKLGPRVRLGCVMTDLELEPDPIVQPGTLCNRCMACVRECPGGQISATERVKVNLAGYDVEWGELNEWGCTYAFRGAVPTEEGEVGHYIRDREDFKPGPITPFYRKPDNTFGTGEAICGGKGCMRACMISLESRGVISNLFKQPFRRRPQWSVDWSDYDPNGPHSTFNQPPLPWHNVPNAIGVHKDKTDAKLGKEGEGDKIDGQ